MVYLCCCGKCLVDMSAVAFIARVYIIRYRLILGSNICFLLVILLICYSLHLAGDNYC